MGSFKLFKWRMSFPVKRSTQVKVNKSDPKYIIFDEFQGLTEKDLKKIWKTFKNLKK